LVIREKNGVTDILHYHKKKPLQKGFNLWIEKICIILVKESSNGFCDITKFGRRHYLGPTF